MVAASPVCLCAFADLRDEYMYTLVHESHVRVLMYLLKKDSYMFITLLTIYRK